MTDDQTPEFSVTKKLSDLGSGVGKAMVADNDQQRAALARRFDLRGIEKLKADYSLQAKSDRISFSGTLFAELTQICALSGQDLPVNVEEHFEIAFVDKIARGLDEQEIELTADDCDVIEYEGQKFDIGEAIAQTLYLALDPYAHAPGAEDAARAKGLKSRDEVGPFSGLAALKDKLG